MNYEQNTKKQGKVWLVGAGPSDQELLTVKGKRLLSEADVIVYDRLAGQGVLTYGAEHAEYIDVGKHSGNHRVRQSEINQILVREAMEGKKVVRLKGGDPFVFGRGAEEAEELKKAGIPFEIVPGVTSAVSVPAYQGIPVTHRDAASSLHIITAHKKEGHEPDEIPFRELAGVKGTLVFLMGVSTLCKSNPGGNGSADTCGNFGAGNDSKTAEDHRYLGNFRSTCKRDKDSDSCNYCCGRGMRLQIIGMV